MIIVNDEDALRVECEDVLPEEVGPLREALENELKNSERLGRPGIGLSAPQIGIPKRMAIVRIANNGKYDLNVDLVNCKIDKGYDKAIFEKEGCLSFPGRYERTFRFQEIYVVENMVEPYSFIATGLPAVVVQHEYDHLISRLLPDVAIAQPKKKLRPNDICDISGKKLKKCCGKVCNGKDGKQGNRSIPFGIK